MPQPSTRFVALTFTVAFALALAWLWPLTMLYDTDSSYHLAVAREYSQHGILHELPWARFSLMRHGFGDKELLFHLLLAPLMAAGDALLGGKLLIALLVGAQCALLVHCAWPALGRGALYLPALLVFGALSYDLRIIRLRPELLALPLFMAALSALASGRYLLLGVLAFVFSWSYTAVHALLGLCGLCFFWTLARERVARYRMLASPGAGVALGLLLHPQFPHNLRVFYVQNVVFWRYRDQSDMGDEIRALGLARFLDFDWPALLGLVILAAAVGRRAQTRPQLTAATRAYTVAAFVFGLLFVSGGRFALYAWPFALLACAHGAALRGYELGPRLSRLAPRAALAPRVWLVMLLFGLFAAPHTVSRLTHLADLGGCIWPPQRQKLERFARAVPEGAKIAAPWTNSDEYVYFAPQGRYLNLLDPVFMRSAFPRQYALQRALFSSQLSDVPLALAELDSEYLAFHDRSLPLLAAQVRADPRLEPLVPNGQVLYRAQPGANGDFVLDYRVAPERGALDGAQAGSYPRAADARARGLEGIVDTARVEASGCLWLTPQAPLAAGRYEVAATGALRVFLGQRLLVQSVASPRLTLGEGTRFELAADASIAVEVCSGAQPARLYLLRRETSRTPT